MNEAEQILKQINYPSFYAKYIPGFKSNGQKDVLTLCPFHEDKTPSLSVNTETGLYFCHACGAKGNAIQFLQKKENINFKDALQKLKNDEGIITDTDKPPTPAKKAATPRKTSYLSLEQIKALHQQLMRDEKTLKQFQDKYGLSVETIEKYFLGCQGGHYVIPIEIEPGKWTVKEHKGFQTKGSKVTLYPGDVIKEGVPFVVIAEGEFKALLLNQMGFAAVSGTGGANTWKRDWNHLFEGLNVVLAYDNDEPGRQGALKVSESIKSTAKSVKAVQWPSVMDSKDKKDVTDFFLTLGKTKEDFQRLIDTAHELGRAIKEIDGIKFIEPEGYEVKEDRIEKTDYYKDKPVKRLIFHTPLFITGRALNIDDEVEEVEITFRRDFRWKSHWVSKRDISDARKIIEFSAQGLPVNSVNAKHIIEYLAYFEACNMDIIKISFIVKGVGWKLIRDKRVFALHEIVSPSNKRKSQDSDNLSIEFVAEAGFERFVKALKPEGKYPQWREYVSETLKYPYAAFAFYASFTAPLLRILKAPNFIIDFWGNTSCGKTTVLELAASVWGNPHKEAGGLIFSWDSTRVFLERVAHFFGDMPIFPDDSQTVDNRTMTNMLYQIANGVGKGRGSISGIRQNLTWHTVCFSTGEKPLTECTTFSGAQARTISLYGSPFPGAGGAVINDLKQGIREHYGHAGPKFIEGLLPVWEKPDEMTRLREEYRRYQKVLSQAANSEVGDRYSHYFSVLKLAADLVYRFLGIGDPVEAEDSIYRTFEKLIKESVNDADVSVQVMKFILSWANANESFFKDNNRESYGLWKTGEFIGIYPHKLTELLVSKNYSEKTVLRGWAEKGWITREEGHLTCVKRVKFEKGEVKNSRLVTIPWEVVEKFLNR